MKHINPWEPPDSLSRYEYSIFAICEQLHMSKNGSGDRLSDKAWSLCVAALMTRLDTGVDGCAYDEAVKALIVATLKEQAE